MTGPTVRRGSDGWGWREPGVFDFAALRRLAKEPKSQGHSIGSDTQDYDEDEDEFSGEKSSCKALYEDRITTAPDEDF
ncbi:hypothetical protein N0V93_010319 [Gnomoniopsis smithogilvyi]|uniref:Uncharacterized protein n=1 Tax=Gnomoniopsis smithogilvyi TaxID=1191159 RepID=A0A9W8YIJ0_9PEZI|nr:hypothetical protein N0V93_010319 [Gnomoniopsis smithogilvyi]